MSARARVAHHAASLAIACALVAIATWGYMLTRARPPRDLGASAPGSPAASLEPRARIAAERAALAAKVYEIRSGSPPQRASALVEARLLEPAALKRLPPSWRPAAATALASPPRGVVGAPKQEEAGAGAPRSGEEDD